MTFFDNFILDNAVASRTVLDLNTFLRKGYPDSIQVATGEIALMKSLHAGKLELTKPNVVITDAAGVVAGVDKTTGGSRNIGLIMPLVGATHISKRGLYDLSRGRPHWGIDLMSPSGRAKVAAAASGVVIYRSWWSGGGNTIFIRHDDGLHTTVYMHLSSFAVSLRQKVKQGQLIGIEGNTGYSTGPHLHFEVRAANVFHATESGTPVNPAVESALPYTIAPTLRKWKSSAQNPQLYLPPLPIR